MANPQHTPQEAQSMIAENFCWPIECVPVPVWHPRREAWEILDAEQSSLLVSMSDSGKIGYRLAGMKSFDGYPTPAMVAATLTARAEKAEAKAKSHEAELVALHEVRRELTDRAENAGALAMRSQSFIAALCAEELGRGCDGCQETKCPNHPADGPNDDK